MSLNTHGDVGTGSGSGAAAGSQAAAPKLRIGAYASWRADMNVWLQRYGADEVHVQEMDPAAWQRLVDTVAAWKREDQRSALASIGIVNGGSSKKSGNSDDNKSQDKPGIVSESELR